MTHCHTSLHEIEIVWFYDFEPADPATGSGPAVSNVSAFLQLGRSCLFKIPTALCDVLADPDSLIIAAQEANDDRGADYAAE
jgi:hypothetical protein